MKGKVIIECPKCKGLGGMMQINGKQSLCPSCGNLGFIVWTIDLFIQQLFQYVDDNAETFYLNKECAWKCDDVMRLFEEFNKKEEV